MNFHVILDFIHRFQGSEETFLKGCCFWFSYILSNRFSQNEFKDSYTTILYDGVEGHFIYGIKDDSDMSWHYFDIRGDVTDIYKSRRLFAIEWIKKYDKIWYNHLMRDCRDFMNT